MNVISAADGFQVATPLPSAPAAESSRALHLRDIWAAVYRSRFWIAGILGATLLVAVLYILMATRIYESSVSIEVRQEAEKVLGTEADREGVSARADVDRFLQTQLDIIRSRGVANAVAQQLGLYRGDQFLDRMRVALDDKDVQGLGTEEARRELVLRTLQKNLLVEYSGNTRIANLRFRSPDRQLAAQVANAYAGSFIRNNLARKFDSSAYALDFLRNQLREAQARLERSEQDSINYARRTRIVDVSNAAGSNSTTDRPQSLISAQLVQLNEAYATAIADRIAAQQKWQRTQGTPALQLTDVLTNQAVQQLLEKRAELQALLDQQLSTRAEGHPEVIKSRAAIVQLDRQVGAIGGNIRSASRTPYTVALAREQQIKRQLETLKNSTLVEQNQSIELSILRREADTNRQQYEALLKRYNALNAEAGVQTNNLSIVDRAEVPRRTAWPRPFLILAGAMVLGLVLATIFMILREQLFDAVRTPDDVTDRLHLTLLGSVPPSDDLLAEAATPKTPPNEAYASIRTTLALSSERGMPRTVMMTSSQASEGKSSACYGLALSVARLKKTVLIVDVDFRRPNVHNLFDLTNKTGLSNFITGQVPLEQTIQATSFEGVSVIAAGPPPPNPSELISSPQMSDLIRQLGERYDLVIFDSAPVLGLADAIVLSSQVEATLFVIEAGRNSVRGVNAVVRRLVQGGGRIVGVVLSKFDPGRFGYGYGDAYGYSYNYHYADRKR